MTISDGFPGQRLHVLPRPVVADALTRPGTSHLVATDSGYFPHARAHGMTRTSGIDQAIVIACTKGAGWCEIKGVRHEVGPGNVVILPPHVPHRYGADPADPWTLWWLHVEGRDLLEFLHEAGMTADAPVRSVSDVYRVVTLIEEVVARMARDSTRESLVAASGAAWHLMAVLSSDRVSQSPRAAAVENAREYLRSHVAQRVSVADLAALSGMSASHFAALFRKHAGVAVLQFHTQLRMDRARALLDTTDRTVAQIAEDVGYDDPFYFSRIFRKTHGVAPLEYRRQHKG
ncbi:AraC family transcriptional regulator [Microbacterium sp. RD1]|uniref:AraC family transcriptional regulator n=1 Tax=Microbacterium sp. RD1 TaxID=3457313 RepID=UPI003FA5E3F9